MTFTYEADRDEAFRAGLLASKLNLRDRRALTILGVTIPVAALAVWIAIERVAAPGPLREISRVAFPGTALFFVLFAFVLLPRRLRKQIEAVTKTSPAFAGTLSCTVTDEHIESIGGDGSMLRLPWTNIASALETPDLFLLLIDTGGAIYIPRRAVPHNDLATFRALLGLRTTFRQESITE
ncbi:MAG TPA: YcxB family protein [Thermoanaerobaculia bacterium]|jgi:hypothetical protein